MTADPSLVVIIPALGGLVATCLWEERRYRRRIERDRAQMRRAADRAVADGRTFGAPDRGWEIHEPDDRMVIRCGGVES